LSGDLGRPGLAGPTHADPPRPSRTDFAARFRAFLSTKREAAVDVEDAARAIIADVAARGDRALLELTKKFDRLDLDRIGLRVRADEIDAPLPPAITRRWPRLPSRTTASRPITSGRSPRTTGSPTHSASS